jgi:beta-glucuronidase
MKRLSVTFSTVLFVAFAFVAACPPRRADLPWSRAVFASGPQSSASPVPAQSSAANSGPPTLITNIPGRTAISLDGKWKAIVDPYSTGFGMRLYEDRKPGISGLNDSNPERTKAASDLVEYDFDSSGSLMVPGDWNSQRESLFFYEGPVWYRRLFTYQKRAGTRSFLYFGAANYLVSVYLNGKKLGEHEGGFTPFNFEITGAVNDGENFLVVEVNNARRADGVPALNTDWWNYGGLTRDVSLVEVPETFIQDYLVQLAKGSANEIAGWVRLNGAAKPEQVTLEIPEAGIRQTATTNAGGYAEFNFPASLSLWSPENPKLYRVVLSTAQDRIEDEIGFRTIETRGAQILLNGKPVFLRGIAMHEEAPFRGGRAFSPEDAQTLFGWARELGCNFVRLAHYPHNENEIRLADKLGLLLWSEIPVYWTVDWQNPATLENAESQLRDSIARDRNRASIILWSLSNETPPDPARTAFLEKLAAFARTQDSTRLLTSALNHTKNAGPRSRTLNDPLGASLDVLGINEYIGWYEGKPEDAPLTHWTVAYDKPLIVSEFGAGAVAGLHGSPGARFTEEYQARVFEQQLLMIDGMPNLAGMSPWVLMDFHSPRRLLVGVQDYRNLKGVVSWRGERKEAFYVLQKFYRQKASETH